MNIQKLIETICKGSPLKIVIGVCFWWALVFSTHYLLFLLFTFFIDWWVSAIFSIFSSVIIAIFTVGYADLDAFKKTGTFLMIYIFIISMLICISPIYFAKETPDLFFYTFEINPSPEILSENREAMTYIQLDTCSLDSRNKKTKSFYVKSSNKTSGYYRYYSLYPIKTKYSSIHFFTSVEGSQYLLSSNEKAFEDDFQKNKYKIFHQILYPTHLKNIVETHYGEEIAEHSIFLEPILSVESWINERKEYLLNALLIGILISFIPVLLCGIFESL